jgi:hypothetical protein
MCWYTNELPPYLGHSDAQHFVSIGGGFRSPAYSSSPKWSHHVQNLPKATTGCTRSNMTGVIDSHGGLKLISRNGVDRAPCSEHRSNRSSGPVV